jgi:hypothetical protein
LFGRQYSTNCTALYCTVLLNPRYSCTCGTHCPVLYRLGFLLGYSTRQEACGGGGARPSAAVAQLLPRDAGGVGGGGSCFDFVSCSRRQRGSVACRGTKIKSNQIK